MISVYFKTAGGREDPIGERDTMAGAKTLAREDAKKTCRNPNRYLWIKTTTTEGWLLRSTPDPLRGLCGPE